MPKKSPELRCIKIQPWLHYYKMLQHPYLGPAGSCLWEGSSLEVVRLWRSLAAAADPEECRAAPLDWWGKEKKKKKNQNSNLNRLNGIISLRHSIELVRRHTATSNVGAHHSYTVSRANRLALEKYTQSPPINEPDSSPKWRRLLGKLMSSCNYSA